MLAFSGHYATLKYKTFSPFHGRFFYIETSENLRGSKCKSLSIHNQNFQLKFSNSSILKYHHSGKSPSTNQKNNLLSSSYSVAYQVRWNEAQKNLQIIKGSFSFSWIPVCLNFFSKALVNNFIEV